MGKDGTYGFYNQDGLLYEGPYSFMFDLTSSLQSLQNGWFGKIFIADLINSSNVVMVKYGKNNSTSTDDNTIFWNPDNTAGGLSYSRGKLYESRPAFIGLGHELAHISDAWFGSFDESPWYIFNNLKSAR